MYIKCQLIPQGMFSFILQRMPFSQFFGSFTLLFHSFLMVHFLAGDKYSKPADSPNSLIVGNVTLEDAGQYVCKGVQVSTRITEMKDFNITVKVHREWLACSYPCVAVIQSAGTNQPLD